MKKYTQIVLSLLLVSTFVLFMFEADKLSMRKSPKSHRICVRKGTPLGEHKINSELYITISGEDCCSKNVIEWPECKYRACTPQIVSQCWDAYDFYLTCPPRSNATGKTKSFCG
jgi:hypothetical protein